MGKPLRACELLRADRECCSIVSAATISWASLDGQPEALVDAMPDATQCCTNDLSSCGHWPKNQCQSAAFLRLGLYVSNFSNETVMRPNNSLEVPFWFNGLELISLRGIPKDVRAPFLVAERLAELHPKFSVDLGSQPCQNLERQP